MKYSFFILMLLGASCSLVLRTCYDLSKAKSNGDFERAAKIILDSRR